MSLGRPTYSILATRARPSGVESEGNGRLNFERTRPARRQLLFESLGVCVGFGALANGSSGVVDPYPATDGIDKELFECVGER